ncbi:uncharacterized protein PAC_04175 [Phialocephala subalpina]|uniref:N-acetyltransferase domain-containing protein n=1 Tax=Phialocephala subalpina TaxID=576137 RepID=A0A1L7WNF4_9HELO|nr:uncharacterized protein PAC_04175 [Phialocephala subalpina]
MAGTMASPKSQNISENAFFAGYKLAKAARNPSLPSKHSPTAKSFVAPSRSKLSPTAKPFTSTASNYSIASSLSATAPEFVMPQQLPTPPPQDAVPKSKPAQVQRKIVVAGKTGPWPQFAVPNADDNLITADGLDQVALEFDDCVSETGLEDQPAQIVRRTQGEDATNELIDWDGKHWAPVPADWENDRANFTGAFVPNYIREWVQTTPAGKDVLVDTSKEAFIHGKAPVDNDAMIAPLSHPNLAPHPSPLDGDVPTKPATSDIAVMNAQRQAKSIKAAKKNLEANKKAFYQEIENMPPTSAPFAPKVNTYLRPAEEKDAAGIAAVYNANVATSYHLEDHLPVTVEGVQWLIKDAKDKFPFIVAINGSCPKVHGMHNPERVIGFARVEAFEYGMTGAIGRNRSRGAGSCHLHVAPEFRRKLVGYNLMDRLLHMITRSHAYMEGAVWANPGQNKYDESEGCGLWHQLFFKIAMFKGTDPVGQGVKDFLYQKFFFKETARLPSASRSQADPGPARFMDLVFLQREASSAGEFGPYQ